MSHEITPSDKFHHNPTGTSYTVTEVQERSRDSLADSATVILRDGPRWTAVKRTVLRDERLWSRVRG